jgi:hypothetical protein
LANKVRETLMGKTWTLEEIERAKLTSPPNPSSYVSHAGVVAESGERELCRHGAVMGSNECLLCGPVAVGEGGSERTSDEASHRVGEKDSPTIPSGERELPERVWLPDSLARLHAVSPELENVEGAWWTRSQPQTADLRQVAEKAAAKVYQQRHQIPWSDSVDAGIAIAAIIHEAFAGCDAFKAGVGGSEDG